MPPASTRQGLATLLDPDSAQKLNEAEVVLGVVGTGLSGACRQELSSGIALRKHMVVMSHPAFVPQRRPPFGTNLVVIDPDNPATAEIGIVQYLKIN